MKTTRANIANKSMHVQCAHRRVYILLPQCQLPLIPDPLCETICAACIYIVSVSREKIATKFLVNIFTKFAVHISKQFRQCSRCSWYGTWCPSHSERRNRNVFIFQYKFHIPAVHFALWKLKAVSLTCNAMHTWIRSGFRVYWYVLIAVGLPHR